jgi:hypothetical protein
VAEQIEIVLKKERETKNTVRYEEVESESGEPPVIGTLYIQKWALKRLGSPEQVRVKIEVV